MLSARNPLWSDKDWIGRTRQAIDPESVNVFSFELRFRHWGGQRERLELNTWVTVEKHDMGDTLKVRFGIFWAHALEDFFSYWTASPVRDGRCKTSPPAPAIVSPVPYQSQDRLQMAGPLLSRRFWCAAGSLAPPTPFASTTGSALGQSHQSVAAATSPLGWQKDLGGPATPTSAHGLAQHIDHHPVDPATGVDPAAAERPARSTAALYWADHPPGGQGRLDGRFQRLVSHARQPARRSR